MTELCCLRDDLKSLMGIAQQLEPYIKSITSLMEQIQPEVGGSAIQQQQQQQPLPSATSEEQPPQPLASATSGSAPSMQSKALNYSNNVAAAAAAAASAVGPTAPPPPPANFTSLVQPNHAASSASPAPQLLPERIQTAVSLAEYKSR